MQIKLNQMGRTDQIAQLFKDAFTASEGAEEGALVHDLARDLLTSTQDEDIRVFVSEDGGTLCGCAIFTRLRFAGDARSAFLLSPMAVATAHQGLGVGQHLLRGALDALHAEGIDLAVTYGDPSFYWRIGFQPVSTDTVPPPLPLKMPHGWLARSLNDAPMTSYNGPSICAPALNNPDFW